MDNESLTEFIQRRSKELELNLSEKEIKEISGALTKVFGDNSKNLAEAAMQLAKASL